MFFPVFSKKIVQMFGQTFSRPHGFSGLEIELIKQLLGCFLGPDQGILGFKNKQMKQSFFFLNKLNLIK